MRKAVPISPPAPKSGMGSDTRCTNRSYVNGPGGTAIAGEVQVNVGCTESVVAPAGELSAVSDAHAGTAIGPITPVLAVSPVAAVASTRHSNGCPGLRGIRRA